MGATAYNGNTYNRLFFIYSPFKQSLKKFFSSKQMLENEILMPTLRRTCSGVPCSTARRQRQLPTTALRVEPDLVSPSSWVRDLGIFIDADLSMRI